MDVLNKGLLPSNELLTKILKDPKTEKCKVYFHHAKKIWIEKMTKIQHKSQHFSKDGYLDELFDDEVDRTVVPVPVVVDAQLAGLEVNVVVDDVLGSVEAELLEVLVLGPVVVV